MALSRAITYPNEINRILMKPGGPVGIKLRRLSLDIAAESKRLAQTRLGNKHPSDAPRTGQYAESYMVEVQDRTTPQGVAGFEFKISNSKKKYTKPVEIGSPPHIIAARRVKNLIFRSRQTGLWVRKAVVLHPGTKGEHILLDATRTVMGLSGLQR